MPDNLLGFFSFYMVIHRNWRIYSSKIGSKIPIMDNVKFHHSLSVMNATRDINLSPRFLPNYSPMLSPIEEAFSSIKARFSAAREHIQTSNELIMRLNEFLRNFEPNTEPYFRHARSFFNSALQKSPII